MLIELAFIKLTKPQMEQNLDSILERLANLERQVEEGIPVAPAQYGAAGVAPVQYTAAAGGAVDGQSGVSPMYGQLGESGQPMMNPAGMPVQGYANVVEPRTVTIPKAQLEDLNMVRNEWGKIVRAMGMSVRPCYRETIVEPAGESCLCIVFTDAMNFSMGSRPSILGDIERYVEQVYGKSIYFKARLRESGERMDTRYITDEELRENIHMDITIEED